MGRDWGDLNVHPLNASLGGERQRVSGRGVVSRTRSIRTGDGRCKGKEWCRLTHCFLISRICDPCFLSLKSGSFIMAGAGVASGYESVKSHVEVKGRVRRVEGT